MPAHSLTIEFDDLPLISEDGKTGAEISGHAEITYLPEGEWYVSGIEFPNKAGALQVDRGTSLWHLIVAALDSPKRREAIDDAVLDHMAEHGISARSDYDEHNTLHRAAQGV